MKFIKVSKNITQKLEILDIEPTFEAFRKEIDCDYIELHKMGRFMIILDEEGLLKSGLQDNMQMFAGDFLIGLDGVYNWKYEPLEKKSKSEFFGLTEKDIEEIQGAVSFIKILNLADNIESVVMEYSYSLYTKYRHLFEEEEDKATIYITIRKLGKAILQNEEDFTLKERFFIDFLFKNFI